MKSFTYTVDDNIKFFKDITERGYESIFEHPYLAMYKRLHEKYGVKIAIASDFPKHIKSSVITTPWANAVEYANFISSFKSPYIGASLYIGGGEDSLVTALDVIELFRKEMLLSVNIKDSAKYRDAHNVTYFEQAKLQSYVKALADIGYDGELNLECPGFLERYPIELLADIFELFADIGKFICNAVEEDVQ